MKTYGGGEVRLYSFLFIYLFGYDISKFSITLVCGQLCNLRNQLDRSTDVETAKLCGKLTLSCCDGSSWAFPIIKTKL
jgi:hypothetical protein